MVDEAHQLLTQLDFRHQWAKIHRLSAIGCQKILLTASLPQRHQVAFLREAAFSPNAYIIRARSTQPRIAFYQVPFTTPTHKPLEIVIAIAKYLQEHVLGDTGLGIIFCKWKNQVELLHQAFTHCSSFSDHPDRHADELAWTHGERRWIGATTGLIQGIDSPNVCATIFWGLPYGLVNLYQGSGRGGRAGQVSHSVTLNQLNENNLRPKKIDDYECLEEGEMWLGAKECRRLALSRMFDNAEVTCADVPGAALCDFCDPDPVHSKAFLEIVAASTTPASPPAPAPPAPASYVQDEYDDMPDAYDYSAVNLELPFATSASSTFAPPSSSAPAPSSYTQVQQSVVPSMEIMVDAAVYQQQQQARMMKLEILNKLVSRVAKKCAVCWAWTGLSKAVHPYTFGECRPAGTRKPHWANSNWLDIKKTANFLEYTYCFSCHLPQQDNFKFDRHGVPGAGPCPCQDLIAHLTWHIFNVDQKAVWKKACQYFQDLHADMTLDGLKAWYPRTSEDQGFFNGCELVIWYCRTYHNM